MTDFAQLTPDGQAIALLCAPLTARRSDSVVKPLTTAEWARVRRQIASSSYKRPEALLGEQAIDLAKNLEIDPPVAERVARLLTRSTLLAAELDRLASRGIGIVTRAEPQYPGKLRRRLSFQTPPVLFISGHAEALASAGVAVVGSRDVDAPGEAFASRLGRAIGNVGQTVFSGAARGVDRTAMNASISAGGRAVGVVSESLAVTIRRRDVREQLLGGGLTLVTPGHPEARFSAGEAMARNKLIYALAEHAVVVASAAGTGGTWAGAIENVRFRWVPLFVRCGEGVPPGNAALLELGAHPITDSDLDCHDDISGWMAQSVSERSSPLSPRVCAKAIHGVVPNSMAGQSQDRSSGSPDLFFLVWPHIEAFVREGRTCEQVATAFQLENDQADRWLRRAHELGLVEVEGRPERFCSVLDASRAEQMALFSEVST